MNWGDLVLVGYEGPIGGIKWVEVDLVFEGYIKEVKRRYELGVT
jgi:hypothetical protein